MTKYLTLALVFGVAVTAAAPAFAGHDRVEPQAQFNHWFNNMDVNDDGVVSMREHMIFSETMYRESDTNNDGVITKEEMWNHKLRMKGDKRYWEGKDARRANEVNE
jgi:hypothetical protein